MLRFLYQTGRGGKWSAARKKAARERIAAKKEEEQKRKRGEDETEPDELAQKEVSQEDAQRFMAEQERALENAKRQKQEQEPPQEEQQEVKPYTRFDATLTEVDIEKRNKLFNEILSRLYYEDKLMRGRDPLFYRVKKQYPAYNRQGLTRRYIAAWLRKQELHGVFTAGPAMAYQKTIQRIVTKKPFTRLCMDLVDMGTKEIDGYKWLLNVIDTFTKYAWSKPLRDKEGGTVVEALGDVLSDMHEEFGIKPLMIQSDNGSEFKSKEMKQFLEQKEIRQVFSLPHKPQSNGAVERFNGTLERMLNMVRYQDGNPHWPEYLDKIMNNYNNTYQDSIKKTPLEVVNAFVKHNDFRGTYEQLQKRSNVDRPLSKADERLYKVGDKVRIRIELTKRSGRNWSRKHFEIIKRTISKYGPGYARTMYRIKDGETGEVLPRLYQNDQLLLYDQPTTFMPEDIAEHIIQYIDSPSLRQITLPDGRKQKQPGYFVKFVGQKDKVLEPRANLLEDVPKLVKKFELDHRVKWLPEDSEIKSNFKWTP